MKVLVELLEVGIILLAMTIVYLLVSFAGGIMTRGL